MSILDDLFGQGASAALDAGGAQPTTYDNPLTKLMLSAEAERRLRDSMAAINQNVTTAPNPQPETPPEAQPQPAPQPTPQAAPPAAPAPAPQFQVPFMSRMLDIGNAAQGHAADRAMQTLAANHTAQALKARGWSDDDIRAVMYNPEVAQQIFPQAFGAQTVTANPGQVILNKKGQIVFDNRERQRTIVPAGSKLIGGNNEVIASGGLTEGDRAQVQKLTEQLEAVRQGKEALRQASEYAKAAYASPASHIWQFLTQNMRGDEQPRTDAERAAFATAQLDNIAKGAALNNAKVNGGSRVTVYLDRAFTALAPNSGMSAPTRAEILARTAQQAEEHEKQLRSEIEGVKTGAIYQPGQTPGALPQGQVGAGAGWVELGNGVRIRRTGP